MKRIITISREFGSGGREIGKKLAEALDVPFYDNEIISRAAKESGFAESAFERAEEKATNSLLYSIALGMNVFANQETGLTGLSLDDKVFLAQSNEVRKAAKESSCVIVGHCADYILSDMPNVINIFIRAGLDFRMNRAIQEYKIPVEKAAEEVLKNDKRRANYYKYHAGDRWANMNNYHLSLRSDFGGTDHAVKTILTYLNMEER